MPVTFGSPPPGGAGGGGGGGPAAPSSSKSSKAHPPGVKEILKTVTPNYVVTAVIKNRLEEGKIKAQKKKRRTRQEILATMDLRELQVCLQQALFVRGVFPPFTHTLQIQSRVYCSLETSSDMYQKKSCHDDTHLQTVRDIQHVLRTYTPTYLEMLCKENSLPFIQALVQIEIKTWIH